MNSTVVRLTLVALALFAVATVAVAQTTEIRGTVQRIDLPSGTVYFTDGRTVRLDPGARLYIGSRDVRLADVQPGWVLVTSGPMIAPGTVIVQPSPPALAAQPSAAYPAVDATGVVAQVDSRTGMVTLQDGRMLRVTPGTTLWQPVTIGTVKPGAAVFVRNAEALDFRPAASSVAARPFQMGTISSVDASNARVVLTDGTVVHLRPGAQATYNGRSLSIVDLRPGDEVVIGLPSGGTVAVAPSGGSAVSALPGQVLGVIEGEYVYVVSRPQAP